MVVIAVLLLTFCFYCFNSSSLHSGAALNQLLLLSRSIVQEYVVSTEFLYEIFSLVVLDGLDTYYQKLST
jgi:hypothetical protein